MKNNASNNANDAKKMKDSDSISRLWRHYIWPQKGKLFAAIFFMVLLAAATPAYTWVVKLVIDQALALENETEAMASAVEYAKIIIPFLIGVPIVSGLANYVQRILTNDIALNAIGEMQKQMFASAHRADYAAFTKEPVGNLISKFINDVTVISNAIIRALGNLFRDVLMVIFLIAAMLWHSWQLSLSMAGFLLALLPIIHISQKMRGNARDVQEHIGTITSQLKESFSGARMVKTYGLEAVETKRLGQSFDDRIRLFLKLITQQARVDPILEVVGGFAIAGIVIMGAYLVNAKLATGGEIGAVLTSMLILSPRLRALGTLNNVVQEGLSAVTRIFDVIDTKPSLIDKPEAITLERAEGHIIFDHVSFHYPDGTQALHDISFSINPGDKIAFVGASGGGKSTIINLIPRLYDVTQGSIKIDDHDIRDLNQASLRKNIALVSQDVTLFEDTIAANIGLGDLNAERDKVIMAAKHADAHDFISDLPQGYDTVLSEDGMSLSGGQRQRLSIARAILRDAPILLLDEATSALDAETEANVQSALDTLSKDRTTLIIAHRLSTVKSADRIFVLDKGQLIESGSHDKLSAKADGAYAKLAALQLKP